MSEHDNQNEQMLKAKKKIEKKRMQPLLEACDEIRDDLKMSGLQIQVEHDSWMT